MSHLEPSRLLTCLGLTLAAAAGLHAAAGRASAQDPFAVVHAFGGVKAPTAPRLLIQADDGNLYGVSSYGGSPAIARVTPAGRISVVHSFTKAEGTAVTALLQAPNGNLYGTTSDGGTSGVGTIFRVNPDGTLTTLHHFSGHLYGGAPGDDGARPMALLRAADGNFYGVTYSGGSTTYGRGTFFSMTPDGIVSILHSFTELSNPSTLMQASDGHFYGGTDYQLFRVTSAGTATVFTPGLAVGGNTASEYSPSTLIEGTDGILYGSTRGTCPLSLYCGAGLAFKLSTEGQVTVLHRFTLGDSPNGRLVQVGDGFYGTTDRTIFKMTSTGEATVVHDFAEDAEGPSSLIRATAGTLYGATTGTSYIAGNLPLGRMFSVAVDDTFISLATSFSDGPAGGAIPTAAFLEGADGHFYGATSAGGTFGLGTIFKLTKDGSLSVLHNFAGGLDGAGPYAPLIQTSDGDFYGTTIFGGGSADAGTVFRMTAAGVVTIVHRFAGDPDGAYPYAPLMQAADGSLYGTTVGFCRVSGCTGEGTGAGGTIFRMPLNGPVTIVRRLDGSIEGVHPYAGLVQGTDGNFYGTTTQGRTYSPDTAFNYNGTIFRMTPAGAFTVLHGFNLTLDGGEPHATLVRGSDGDFYGTTTFGGAKYGGTVFRIAPSGSFTLLHSLDTDTEGDGARAPLLQSVDGSLYGVTEHGAGSGVVTSGAVLQIDRTGTASVVHAFTGGTDGAGPAGGLIQAADGTLYGTTSSGGLGVGVVYRIAPYAPALTAHPSIRTVSVGHPATFTVTASGLPAPTYRWQLSTDAGVTWENLTDTTPYSGSTTAALTVATVTAGINGYLFRAVVRNSVGIATSSMARLLVFGPVAATPSALHFGAVATGTALQSVTGAQTVTVMFGGAPGAWTAATTQTWLSITGGSGSGAGGFAVGIRNPGNVTGAGTSLLGTITLTSPTAPNSPLSIPVTLTVTALTQPPLGVVDTPAQSATGVAGSIAVTGWALDDVGVQSVKLYRNCVAFEPAANCAMVGGYNLVYMGQADVVPGARPDVEAAYPTFPQANRAGWGYLLLTNMLPHIPSGQMYGGQGAFSIYVIATDAEGHVQLLGRGTGDQNPTTITLTNDAAVKPFGAIDTPGQGHTVSGMLNNWGWALTPDTTPSSNIVVPPTGSTVWVWIDGAPVGHPLVNLCRGTVGVNPTVPAGSYCDDDVANIFGNPTPQPTFQRRTSNVSKYRNLDAGQGAIGVYTVDTTTLTNGRHSIVWGVTDNAGRVDGIGSRDFIVLNSGADAMAADLDARTTGVWAPTVEGLRAAPVVARGDSGALDGLAPAAGMVWGRTGFDVQAPLVAVPADEAGRRQVQFAQLGRLELRLGAVDGGYLVANGTLRDLPPGSRLDPASGVFTWTPGVAYFGAYRLAFVRGGAQIKVDVTIRPVEAAVPGGAAIRMHVDVPIDGAVVRGAFTVAGWALDPQTSFGSGIAVVHVWAQRRDQPGVWPEFLGAAMLGGARPDVAAAFGPQFGTAGFSLTTDRLEPGQYDVTAFAWNRRTARWEDARTVTVTVR